MSYEEILEKIQKARALADSRKEALATGKELDPPKKPDAKKSEGDLKYRDSVQEWTKPSDLAPDGKTFLDLFTSRWKCYSKWPDNKKELDSMRLIDLAIEEVSACLLYTSDAAEE